MAAPQALVQAVQAAIVASALMTAFEQVAAATHACQRLGGLTSGRWRSVARDLDGIRDELQRAFASAAETVAQRAASLGIEDEALWTAGDAAATLDLLRESALVEVEEDSPGARVLQGEILYGTSFVEDPDVPDRGTTLLFGWPEPLTPATWPWQANWVVGDPQDDGEIDEELDLYETGELEGEHPLLTALADDLQCSRDDARTALRDAALALTRASLLAVEPPADDEDEEGDEAVDSNGER